MSDARDDAWRAVFRFPARCTEDVTREGLSEPCDKRAVAVRIDPREGGFYPVCSFHTSRGGVVPLTDVIAAAARLSVPDTQETQ